MTAPHPRRDGWRPTASGPLFSCLASARLFLFAAIASFALATPPPSQAGELPRTENELVETVRAAIAAHNYGRFDELVNWEGAGDIKRRIVAFEIRRGLGRPVQRISFEAFPEHGLDGLEATGKLKANMPVSNRLRVVYDEPPINTDGKQPTSVFLVGKQDGAYRIALVVRRADTDDDD